MDSGMSGGFLVTLLLALFVLYVFAKTAVVVPQQSAYVVERLGKYSATLDAGFHVSDYHREHALAMRPTLTSRLYDNAGYKQEQSAFGKVGYTTGDWRFAADVQLRRAAFQYHPSVGAGISPFGTDWTFLNPKLSVAYTVRPGVELFGSWGRTGREPARADLFAGAGDMRAGSLALMPSASWPSRSS